MRAVRNPSAYIPRSPPRSTKAVMLFTTCIFVVAISDGYKPRNFTFWKISDNGTIIHANTRRKQEEIIILLKIISIKFDNFAEYFNLPRDGVTFLRGV